MKDSERRTMSAEECAKGFVRPVRLTNRHVGAPALKNLRDLTDKEHKRYDGRGYVKFELYGAERAPLAGSGNWRFGRRSGRLAAGWSGNSSPRA